MAGLVPYLFFPGTATEALTFYHGVFGGDLALHTYADFGRTDGPANAVAHGILSGDVNLFGADAGPDEDAVRIEGAVFSLLGTADPTTLARWFAKLSDGGVVSDPLQERPWGAHDGRVTDRFGIRWLIGYE
ncbi:VOC family protein [Microbacterium lacus]|uniref:VOC family protein n=1 Tax=Microbacterium lacus TaxID=415217 RepID=UPI00384C1E0A